MDALKQQLLKIQQQLAGLSASQKMLTASLLVIMVMTLFYWSKFAGQSEMVAAMDGTLSSEELSNVQRALNRRGVTFEMRDNKVMVPAGRMGDFEAAMADLGYDDKAPAAYGKMAESTDSGFNILEGESGRNQRMQARRQQMVERMIRQWPGVKNAMIIIAGEQHTGILNRESPTASVAITLDGGADVKKVAQSARVQVAKAQPGLKPDEVGVTVNGITIEPNSSDGELASGDRLAELAKWEKRYSDKILESANIVGARATVSIMQRLDDVYQEKRNVDPKNTATAVKSQTTVSEENGSAAAPAEPGVTANIGVNADPQPTAGKGSTMEKSDLQNETAIGYDYSATKSRAGLGKPNMATLRVPESHFRQMWKQKNPKATAGPSDADVKQLFSQELPSLVAAVKAAVDIEDDKRVSVVSYFDLDPTPSPTETVAAAGLATLPVGNSFGAKEIAIGALALISLFMVSMMVKKSTPPTPVLAMPTSAVAPEEPSSRIMVVNDLAGEVAEATLSLTGQELSQEAIESKQVIEQVGSMVKENPDVAANLVKRWLNHE